jgi:hypothetical protein
MLKLTRIAAASSKIASTRFFNSRPADKGKPLLTKLKQEALHAMQQKYPGLLLKKFNQQIAYTLRPESPSELLHTGGLLAASHDLWLSNTGSGKNTGSVCFSLLPEITTIFLAFAQSKSKSKTRETYLYAFLLTGEFILPGGPWRQIISPGAFPLPPVWRARQFLGLDFTAQRPPSSCIRLGSLSGEGELSADNNPRLASYLNTKEHLLIQPRELSLHADFPPEYDIQDTPESAEFQQKVEEHYEQAYPVPKLGY